MNKRVWVYIGIIVGFLVVGFFVFIKVFGCFLGSGRHTLAWASSGIGATCIKNGCNVVDITYIREDNCFDCDYATFRCVPNWYPHSSNP